MRLSVLLLFPLGGVASAEWLKWQGIEPVDLIPRETGPLGADVTSGWTPKPTTHPGGESPSRAVLELFRRQTKASTSMWINGQTCGYWPGTSSAPWTCQSGMTCATNDANVVACVSGTFTPFYTACFDFEAFQAGACSSIGIQTGCCQVSEFGACGTFLWTESPSRSMYRCFSTATIINILDEPQFVLDEATRITTSSSATSPATNVATVTAPGSTAAPPPSSSSGPNVSAIVGGIVGGLALLSLLVVLLFCCLLRRRRSRGSTKNTTKTKVSKQDVRVYNSHTHTPPAPGAMLYAPSTTASSPGPSPHNPHYSLSSSLTTPGGVATTFPPYSPYPATAYPATTGQNQSVVAAYHEGYEAAAFHQGYEAAKRQMAEQSYIGHEHGDGNGNSGRRDTIGSTGTMSPNGRVRMGNPRHESVMSELEGSQVFRTAGEPDLEKQKI